MNEIGNTYLVISYFVGTHPVGFSIYFRIRYPLSDFVDFYLTSVRNARKD